MGYLCRSLPYYVQKPPIEAVVFGWGVNEDGQLVSLIVQALELACHSDSLHSAPALLHAEALHRGCYVLAGLNKDIQLVSLIPLYGDGQHNSLPRLVRNALCGVDQRPLLARRKGC